MTWKQIAQAITNALAASQNASSNGNTTGNEGNAESENSNMPWAVIALAYNETLGPVTPETLKSSLEGWASKVQNAATRVGRTDIGGWLVAMKFLGHDLTNSQLQPSLALLNARWKSTANHGLPGNFGNPYTMWMIYAGLETTIGLDDSTHITDMLTDCGSTTNEHCRWSEDYDEWLVKNQNIDGSWDGYSRWTAPIATALYVNILGATRIPIGPYKCPMSQSFWRKTPASWPVASLSLGGQTYTKEELLAFLEATLGSGIPADPSVIVAGELVAAKLNVARGSDRVPVARTIVNADTLLSQFKGKIPLQVATSSFTGQKMADVAKILASYSNGVLTPGCISSNELREADAQERLQAAPRSAPPIPGSQASRESTSVSTAQNLAAGNTPALRPRVRKGVTALATNGDGSLLASGSTDNTLRIWNATTGLQTAVIKGSLGLPTGLVFSPGGNTLSSVGRDSVVRIWDVVGGNRIATLTGHEHAIRTVAASPDGKFLASAGEETRIMLWDLASRKLSKILYGPADFVNALSFSPDSQLLASAGEDGRVLVFDVASAKLLYTLRGHSGPVDAVAFSPDGTVLASGGQDTVIHLWNPANGQQLQVLKGHAAPIETIVFSPDGKSIASGGEDALIILWDARTGVLDKTLFGSTGAINVLVFAPRAKFLAAASDAGDITLWNVVSGRKLLTIPASTTP